MKKLEDIPKTNIFKVPDGYFDSLPSIIQARVAKKENTWMPTFQYALKYALPVLIIAVGLIWLVNSGNQSSGTEQLLTAVSSDDLMAYIQDSDMTTEDLMESLDYTQINADSLDLNEADFPLNTDDLSDMINEF